MSKNQWFQLGLFFLQSFLSVSWVYGEPIYGFRYLDLSTGLDDSGGGGGIHPEGTEIINYRSAEGSFGYRFDSLELQSQLGVRQWIQYKYDGIEEKESSLAAPGASWLGLSTGGKRSDPVSLQFKAGLLPIESDEAEILYSGLMPALQFHARMNPGEFHRFYASGFWGDPSSEADSPDLRSGASLGLFRLGWLWRGWDLSIGYAHYRIDPKAALTDLRSVFLESRGISLPASFYEGSPARSGYLIQYAIPGLTKRFKNLELNAFAFFASGERRIGRVYGADGDTDTIRGTLGIVRLLYEAPPFRLSDSIRIDWDLESVLFASDRDRDDLDESQNGFPGIRPGSGWFGGSSSILFTGSLPEIYNSPLKNIYPGDRLFSGFPGAQAIPEPAAGNGGLNGGNISWTGRHGGLEGRVMLQFVDFKEADGAETISSLSYGLQLFPGGTLKAGAFAAAAWIKPGSPEENPVTGLSSPSTLRFFRRYGFSFAFNYGFD